MNKKGQVILYYFMIAVFIIILAIVLINPLKTLITEVRDPAQLNCSSTSLTFGQESTCLFVDLILPYFIIALFAFAFIILFKRKKEALE